MSTTRRNGRTWKVVRLPDAGREAMLADEGRKLVTVSREILVGSLSGPDAASGAIQDIPADISGKRIGQIGRRSDIGGKRIGGVPNFEPALNRLLDCLDRIESEPEGEQTYDQLLQWRMREMLQNVLRALNGGDLDGGLNLLRLYATTLDPVFPKPLGIGVAAWFQSLLLIHVALDERDEEKLERGLRIARRVNPQTGYADIVIEAASRTTDARRRSLIREAVSESERVGDSLRDTEHRFRRAGLPLGKSTIQRMRSEGGLSDCA